MIRYLIEADKGMEERYEDVGWFIQWLAGEYDKGWDSVAISVVSRKDEE